MSEYKPPFSVTNKIIELVSQISELIGQINSTAGLVRNPVLRRKNRILTIHSSLGIEQNTLTLDQVTAVINGKTVLAPPKDIEEVKNAYEIYENMDLLNPYGVDDLLKAHGVMMRGLVEGCGEFRTKPVGVADSRTGEIIHVGTLPDYVPEMVCQLLNWTEESNVHMLIKSCVFHYEFEVIHPFSDGNGRTGRLWHTLLLSKWKSIFAWLPIESMIFKRQAEYYKVINRCNYNADSTEFIEFMLETIKMTLEETILTCAEGTSQEQVEEQVDFDKLLEFCKTPRTRAEMQKFCKIEGRKKFSEKYLKPLLAQGKLAMTIPEKPQSRNQKYYKV
ncbi:MAG: Fic family protein [Hominimerdicola sp.]